MTLDNIFFFKNIVDSIYPDENRPGVDIQQVVSRVKLMLSDLSDENFVEVITCCFIPDLYKGMGIKEKLFTKLTELMVGEWWHRMGGTYNLPTKKSGTEDVELILGDTSIVCDAKVFRLGRSQKAPNVKDFLKLASVRTWIDNLRIAYEKRHIEQNIIGGLVTYSSLHEWESDSEVYQECTNLDTPVVMLPYEVLALLLQHKGSVNLNAFLKMWDYRENHVRTSRNKADYWEYIKSQICPIVHLTSNEYDAEMKNYHANILAAVKEYRKVVQDTIDQVIARVSGELNQLDSIEEVKEYAIRAIIERDNAVALDYLKHIDDFRYYRDQN